MAARGQELRSMHTLRFQQLGWSKVEDVESFDNVSEG